MNSEFESIIKDLEIERERILGRWRNLLIITIILLLFLLLSFNHQGITSTFSIFFLILFLIISFISYSHFQSKWEFDFRRNLIGKIVKTLLPDLEFKPDEYISEDEYFRSRLFERSPRPDRYNGENLLEGKIGYTKIRASWIHSEYETHSRDSDDNEKSEWHTIFMGFFVIAEFNKRFSSTTVVLPDSLIKLSPKGLERAKLEDPEFESIFDVYTNDQVEARYILTPAFMEKIKKYREKLKSEIRLSFIDSILYLTISSSKRVLVAPSFLRSLNDIISEKVVERYKEEILFMISVVEELELNLRLWSDSSQS